jgi:hypothetical protein
VVVAPASAPDAGRRHCLQEQLAKLSEGRIPPFDVTPDQIPAKLKEMAEKGHCDRVLHETEEMLRKWPDAGMTPRRQRLLNKILEERDRCVRRWNEQR